MRFKPDTFTLLLLSTVTIASLAPATGIFAEILNKATTWVIVLLFFLHGSKLSRQAIWAGIGHWRLHLVVTATTFMVFPLVGWLAQPLWALLLPPPLVQGMLFLCALPATVQSAIALTSSHEHSKLNWSVSLPAHLLKHGQATQRHGLSWRTPAQLLSSRTKKDLNTLGSIPTGPTMIS